MKDPIVEEVRRHRMEHTRQYHGDLDAICAALRELQKASGCKIVNLAPKRTEKKRQTGKRAS